MNLLDVFKDLSYGELRNNAIGNLIPDDNESEPDPKDYAQILSHLNRGLDRLYGRFFLASQEIYIQQYEAIETYVLDSRYAESNTASLEPIKYIADTVANPFQDNVLKIEQCFDELGNILFLNDQTEELSLFTPTFKSIQMPWPNEFNTVAVQFRAKHPDVIWTQGMDAELVEVAIPDSLYEALLHFIAYRAAPKMDGGAEAMAYLAVYEQICKQVEKDGLYIQTEPGNWRFDWHGWV